jgi:hypothetical protein
MKKIIFCLIILISVSTIAYAQQEPSIGTPLQGFVGIIYTPDNECYAYIEGVDSIGGVGTWKVVKTPNKVVAVCKFTDVSGLYERTAQVGGIDNCMLFIYEGEDLVTYGGGIGTITAAANHGDSTGGTTTMQCTFNLD